MARRWRAWALGLASFGMLATSASAFEPLAFSVVGSGGQVVLRWIGAASACPNVQWDEQPMQAMRLRSGEQILPAVPSVSRVVDFPVRVCELAWPQGVRKALVGAQQILVNTRPVRRVAILADTGCRMKAAENAFQDCNDPRQWPFARIADAAARKQPDLVLHLGDIHYRESPCPVDRAGCVGSPSGYGWSAWQADFFDPARRLLQAAPWVFVRGNHESCSRAGQGWFRMIDAANWSSQRSCNEFALDAAADHSEPYAVPVAGGAQLIVFDSSRAVNQTLAAKDDLYVRYRQDMEKAEKLAHQGQSVFLSHHPLLAVYQGKGGKSSRPGGNASLLSVAQGLFGDRLFPDPVDWAMHGHIHVFESLSFRSGQAASLVLGNSGSAMDVPPPTQLPKDFQVLPGAHFELEAYAGHARFGFSLLDIAEGPGQPWVLTQYDVEGEPMLVCELTPKHSHCTVVH